MIPKNILDSLSSAKLEHKKIVLVTGVFDILHEEHFNFLQKARQEGDLLLIAIESDKRVEAIKGKGRPINSQFERRGALENLEFVDLAMVLPDNFSDSTAREEFISLIKPDVLAVSSHSSFKENKSLVVEKYGGKLKVVLEHNPDFSTSKMIENSDYK